MVEVHSNLFVGSAEDREPFLLCGPGRSILCAAKEPFHRQVLGYTTPAAPRNHPEYLFARRGNCLYLNLIDAESSAMIPKPLIDEALRFISERISEGDKLLIFCNKGESRAPGLAFLWMYQNGQLPQDFMQAGPAFKRLYPEFYPNRGMFHYIKSFVSESQGVTQDGLRTSHPQNQEIR